MTKMTKPRFHGKLVVKLLVLALIFYATEMYSSNNLFREMDYRITETKYNNSSNLVLIKNYQSTEQKKEIKGVVKDADGNVLPGSNILVKGTTNGASTDINGEFTINVEDENAILVISYLGFVTQEVFLKGRSVISVYLVEDAESLDELVLVGYGTQKKASVVSSVVTVKPAELRIPTSNLTTALAGRVAGLISYQSSGEPGRDNADFFIRGVTTFGFSRGPLILVDNVELTAADLARIEVDNIASFSILRDANATAIYGARGANGVILVTTKEGVEGKLKVNVRFENSWSQPTENLKFADPITYMNLHNEAVKTRNPAFGNIYSQQKIARSMDPNRNPNVYPTINWQEMLFKDRTANQRFNMNASGGGQIARYFFAGSFRNDSGVLKVDDKNDFNSNINIKQYILRSNININITPKTKATVRFNATFDDYTGPIDGGSGIYAKAMRANPVLFPATYAPDDANIFAQNILFGNSGGEGNYVNPYADMVRGYQENSRALMLSQLEIDQDLSGITKGLKFFAMANINRTSFFGSNRFYNPFYYEVQSYDINNDKYVLNQLNPDGGSDALSFQPAAGESITSVSYFETRTIYNRTFNEKHDIGGLLVTTAREARLSNATDLQSSLAKRNLNFSGRFTYGYDSRYFAELVFGYNGSERFSKDERFGFFPSYGLGWVISNEKFMAPFKEKITNLKLRATYGRIGNDAIGSDSDRFFYLSNVNLNDPSNGYQFGTEFNYTRPGNSIQRYANDLVTWETSDKLNLGIDLQLFYALNLQVDVYSEYRTNILMDRIDIPSTMGLQAAIKGNIGESSAKGIDVSLDGNHSFASGLWLSGRVNFTYAASKFEVFEEPNYDALGAPWRSRVGQSLGQNFGYVAERLFIDQADVDNSPEQFGVGFYGAGDIKYKDINGNGRIDELDKVPIGHPTNPEIVYGFGLSSGYKNLDVSFFFQGLANRSFWINPRNTAPFIDSNTGNNLIDNNALLQVYADNVWLENNRNPYAMFPRLSTAPIENNEQLSTWFMRDGSFLRLKNIEIGYTIPEKIMDKFRFTNARFYLSGTNLLTFSKFDLWDVEMGGNGIGYPIQSVFNLGIQASF